MQITQSRLVSLGQDRGEPLAFLKRLLDPMIAVAALLATCAALGAPPRAAEVVLAALAFSLTWPGQVPFRRARPGLLRELAVRWGIAVALLAAFGVATGVIGAFDRDVLATWAVATPLLQYAAHRASPSVIARLSIAPRPVSAVIAGAGPLGRQLAGSIAGDPFEVVHISAFFDDRTCDRNPTAEDARAGKAPGATTATRLPPLAGRLSEVAGFVRAHRIQRIYVALPMASQPRILALLDALRDTTASIYFAPDIFVHDLIQARVETIGGMPVVAVCESPFHGAAATIKRLSDIALASVAIVLAAPLMITVAVLIAATSPGPILFRQRRYGLDGHEIEVWKFRSMRVLEDGAVVRQASRDDDRVTAVGRFIRRTSIDELPQFFNVLQGRMSVVGPRPHAVAHNEMYRSLVKGYMVRHKVKPGITGWAQVNGARGETATVEAMRRRIDYDLEYLRNWSLALDLRIVLRTVALVFRDPNAY